MDEFNKNEELLNDEVVSEKIEETENNIEEVKEEKPEETVDIIVEEKEGNSDGTFGENISNESIKKRKFPKKFKKIVAVACCVTIFAGVSSSAVGFGYRVTDEILSRQELSNFSFEDIYTNTDDTSVGNTQSVATSSSDIAALFKQVKDSVVNISITSQQMNFFYQTYETTGSGSGIIYKKDNEKVYIVTNNHVIEGASKVSISITGKETVNATLVGSDAQSDLAVISVLLSDLKAAGISEIKVAEFAKTDNVEIGEYVLAIGNALGEGKTVTRGIISASNKEINIDGKKLTVLQTDAAINPGNSGGALVNSQGKVIGINTAKLSSSAIEGIGYAIPSATALTIIDQLMTTGSVERPYFGIIGTTITDSFKQMYNINFDGVFVTEVEEGYAASEAGLQATDIIVGFNSKQIKSVEELSDAIKTCSIGQNVTIDIIRNGVTKMSLNAKITSANKNF